MAPLPRLTPLEPVILTQTTTGWCFLAGWKVDPKDGIPCPSQSGCNSDLRFLSFLLNNSPHLTGKNEAQGCPMNPGSEEQGLLTGLPLWVNQDEAEV